MAREIYLTLPLSNDGRDVRTAVVGFPPKITAAEWGQLLALLDLMRPTLVADEREASDGG